MNWELVTPLITILGAGISSYVGVRVAIAEMRVRLDTFEDNQKDLKSRIERMEAGYFKGAP